MKRARIVIAVGVVVAVGFGLWFAVQKLAPHEAEPKQELKWYQIPQLGVEFQVPADVADELIFTYRSYATGYVLGEVAIAPKKLTEIPGCGDGKIALFTLSRFGGTPEDHDVSLYLKAHKLKQFDGYFILIGEAQTNCALPDHEKELDLFFVENKGFNNLPSQVFDTMREIPSLEEQYRGREDELVWYSVPELGVRFKVTSDSRGDLKYTTVNNSVTGRRSAYFYRTSVQEFDQKYGIPCELKKKETPFVGASSSCTDFFLSRVNAFENQESPEGAPRREASRCEGSVEFIRKEQYSICGSNSQASSITGPIDLYEEMSGGKNYGVFIDTVEVE